MEHWIGFPGLGIEQIPVQPSVVQFSLFGMEIDIRFYGLIIAIGFLLAVVYAFRQAPRMGIDVDRMIDVVLVAAVVAVVCARLYYVVFSDNAAYYFENPLEIVQIWDGGLAIYGGVIGAFVTGFIMCRVRKVNALALFDLAAIGFLIGQGLGRWGNFFNQEAHGGPTDLPWGMTGDIIGDTPVHPTFLYESLWCLLGVLLLHLMLKKCYRFRGQLFGAYMIWYGAERLFVEGLRTDSLYIPGTELRVSQLVSAAAILAGVVLMIVLYRRSQKQGGTEPLYAKVVAKAVTAESEDGEAVNEGETVAEESPETLTLETDEALKEEE